MLHALFLAFWIPILLTTRLVASPLLVTHRRIKRIPQKAQPAVPLFVRRHNQNNFVLLNTLLDTNIRLPVRKKVKLIPICIRLAISVSVSALNTIQRLHRHLRIHRRVVEVPCVHRRARHLRQIDVVTLVVDVSLDLLSVLHILLAHLVQIGAVKHSTVHKQRRAVNLLKIVLVAPRRLFFLAGFTVDHSRHVRIRNQAHTLQFASRHVSVLRDVSAHSELELGLLTDALSLRWPQILVA